MAQSVGTHPYLGTVFVDTSSNYGQSYSQIGNITKFAPLKMKRGKSNTTYLGSTGEAKTLKPGWIDPDTLKVTVIMQGSVFTTLYTYFSTDSDVRYYKIRYNDGTSSTSGSNLIFLAMISELGDDELSRDSDEPIMTEITLSASALPGFTAAT
jgi:hypothetical protein